MWTMFVCLMWCVEWLLWRMDLSWMGVVCMADNIVCLLHYYTFEPNCSQTSFIIVFIHLHVVLDGQWVKEETITNCPMAKVCYLLPVGICLLCWTVHWCKCSLSVYISIDSTYTDRLGLWLCFIPTDCPMLKPFITTDLPSVFSDCGIV
jgi:hypothetical protein